MLRETSRFRYRAIREDGTVETGFATAETRGAVVALLAARRAMPLEIVASNPGAPNEGRSMPLRDLAIGLRTLATLVSSGLPLSKALTAFSELAPAAWLRGLDELRDGVRQGRTFAGALETSNVNLPSTVIGVIRAGESAGRLPAALKAAADMTEFQASARAALQSALVYPLILTIASIAALTLLLGVVVPRFAAALAETMSALPPSTRALITLAAWIRASIVPGLLASAVVLVGWRIWIRLPKARLRWDKWMLSIPIAGSIRHSAATSRLCDALATLLQSGVPVAPAIAQATPALTNSHLAACLAGARESVLEGTSLSRALAAHAVTTVTAVRLMRAGEESGHLTSMLAHAAEIERTRVEQLTKNALRLLEPALILTFGCVVAAITAALLQALYSVRPGS